MFKRIDIPGPDDGSGYVGKDANRNRDQPTNLENNLEDSNGRRRGHYTERPTDLGFIRKHFQHQHVRGALARRKKNTHQRRCLANATREQAGIAAPSADHS